MSRKTHAENVKAMSRKPVDTSRANTAADQMVDELLRVIRLGWAGAKPVMHWQFCQRSQVLKPQGNKS